MKTSTSPTPLRVLLLNEFFYPDNQGGTATATANIASALKGSNGAEVTVITSCHAYRDSSVRYERYEAWNGIDIHRVSSPNWLRKSTLQRLAGNFLFAWTVGIKALFLPKPDVVLVTTAPLTLPIAARLLKRFRGVPYAYLIYDLDPDRTVALGLQGERSASVRALRTTQRKWLSNADRVLAIGRCMRDLLVRKYELDPEKISVVEVGADPNVIRPLPRDTQFRRKHGLDGFVALYSGNFGQYHDFDAILDAAETLKASCPSATFVLVGGGHKKEAIAAEIAKRSLSNVLLLPFVPESELADLLASADVHLVTMEAGMEGLCVPSKFYSCLASGRPVIAIVPEATEVGLVLQETGVGWRIDPSDARSLADLIGAIASDPEGLVDKHSAAREVFDQSFTVMKVGAKMHDVLSLVGQQR